MDMTQILLFGLLLLVPVLTSPCLEEHELKDLAEKRLKGHFEVPDEPSGTETVASASCPVELYREHAPQEISGRSLSPWRYVVKTKPDHFPSTYSEAECLCSGCIIMEKGPGAVKTLVLSDDYNSIPLKQTRKFLKKELCDDKIKYRLKMVYEEVAVGCTCLRPK